MAFALNIFSFVGLLRRQFWWLVLLLIVVSHLYFSWQLYNVNQELRRFEARYQITPIDPHRLSSNPIPTTVAGEWHFMSHLPTKRKYRICAAWEEIDRWPRKDDRIDLPIYPDMWRDSRLPPLEKIELRSSIFLMQENDTTSLRVRTMSALSNTWHIPSDHPLHQRPLNELIVEQLPESPSNDAGLPHLLLRIRDPKTPGRGLVVWMEERAPDRDGW